MDRPDPPDRTCFSPPRARLLRLAAATGVFTAAGALMAGSDLAFWRLAGVLVGVLFAAATVVLLVRALRPGPTVVVDADGITDRTTLAATGLVRWEEIAGVRKREIGRGMGRERLLEVVLLDRENFRSRPRSRVRRYADGYRDLIKQPDVTVPGSMVAAPMASVITALQRWRPELDVMELPPRRPRLRDRIGRRPAYPAGRRHPDLPRW